MSIDLRLHELGRDARRRRAALALLLGAPVALIAIAVAWRVGGTWSALAIAALAIVALALYARRETRAIDGGWIARRLDDADRRLEDSADLLFRDASQLSPLQRLQRARLLERLEANAPTTIATEWSWRTIGLAWLAALVVVALAAFAPRRSDLANETTAAAANARNTAIDRIRLDVAAPAYTHVAARSESSLDARAPEGSRIAWRLRFSPQPNAAALTFHDGARVDLRRDGEDWIGEHTLAASTLYRIVLDGAPPPADDRLHRIDAIADQPPDVRVIEPEKTLTLLADGQRDWALAFEASDDYGIAAANLTITLAQGTGENIAFKEHTIALTGRELDDAHAGVHQRYDYRLDLGELGIAKGDDVIVRLAVSDAREPKPNTTRSASFILRWPPETSSDSVGMEGILEKTMPAYFRSQRQIIIDTEALIADQAKLDEDAVLQRSDGIGVDQKILRLRYGQFLGEESETRSEAEGPGDNKKGKNEADAGRADALVKREEEHKHWLDVEKFGDAGAVTSEYGHVHDVAEAATLLDPETKTILKSALGEMWEAELHLRQGRPADALPYENKALVYIKEVQQSSRIYLARVGLELPAVDETRRLSGDRKGVTDHASPLAPADAHDSGAVAVWQALDAHATPDLDAFDRWLRTQDANNGDTLAIVAAIDRARRDPKCVECRDQLRGLLWPLLPQPAAGVGSRAAPDATGQAYLDALRGDATSARKDASP